MSKISKVIARQVFDSRGNPTIEAEVFSKSISSRAICPSGASTGTFEAYEKRDFNNTKYLGKSVFKPINLINSKISKKLKNQNVHNQELIDSLLINLDGTKQKNNLGCYAGIILRSERGISFTGRCIIAEKAPTPIPTHHTKS